MKNARIYDFTIPANGSFPLNVDGENVRIMSSTGAVEISTDSYRIGPILAGQGQARSPFNRLTINDKSGAANKGTILIASADFIDDRITGEVLVIDGEKMRVMAGSMYSGSLYIPAAVGFYGTHQVYNPAGSGRNLIVKKITVSTGANSGISIYLDQVQFASATVIAANKKGAGAASVGLARPATTGTGPSTPFGTLWGMSVMAGAPTVWEPVGAVIVQPGYALNTFSDMQNNTLFTAFEWFEELA